MKKISKYEKIMAVLKRYPDVPNKELAAQVGVSASYVYKIKNARGDITTGNNNVAVGHAAPSTDLSWELPEGANELQDLISHRNMNAQIGEVFRSCYRYGIALHSDQLRDAKKIKFYIDAEIKRLENRGE